MGFTVLMKLKSGKGSKKTGFKTFKEAEIYAALQKTNCPDVTSTRVMENKMKKHAEGLKPGDPGYVPGSEENSEETNNLAEATSEDFMDGHTHELADLDDSGNGTTSEAGTPPHSHEVKNGIVIPNTGGEGDSQYISYHPGEVTKGAEHEGDETTPPDPDKIKEEGVNEFREKIMKYGELSEVEIFATGNHQGRNYSESDLDEIVTNFSKLGGELKPPMVLGHDEKQEILTNSGLPSLGWAKHLEKKSKGNGEFSIVARLDEVPELARLAVEKGAYKRISSEIYEDFSDKSGKTHGLALRRIALLGADVPEVKTLQDVISLAEEKTNKVIWVHNEPVSGGIMKTKEESVHRTDPAVLAEIKLLKETNAGLVKAHAETAHKAHVASISSFCDELKREGKFLPRFEDQGIQSFMENLDPNTVVKFGEAKDSKKMSSLAFFKELMTGLPVLISLKEETVDNVETIAIEKGAQGSGIESVSLDRATKDFMEKSAKGGKVLSYSEALSEVSRANPGLFKHLSS